MSENSGENTFFVFTLVAIGVFAFSVYLSFTTPYWWAFIVGLVIAYLIGKFGDPKRKASTPQD